MTTRSVFGLAMLAAGAAAQAAIGAEQAAKALDANLFVVPGHYIGKTDSRYADSIN